MLIKRLLILVVICCTVCLAAIGQSRDTTALPRDTSVPVRDSLQHDSTWFARDSLRRDSLMRDSIRKAAAVPSAAALQHQIDSANAATSIVSDPAADSLKLRMDAMMAAGVNGSRGSNGPPGMASVLQHQPPGNAYSPTTGSTSGPRSEERRVGKECSS